MSTKQSKRNRSVRERRTARRLAMLLGVSLLGSAQDAQAISAFWTLNNSGSWNTLGVGGNWSTVAPPAAITAPASVPNGAGEFADFSKIDITAGRTVTLDGSKTVGSILFGDTNNNQDWTLNAGSGGSLILDATSGIPQFNVVNRTVTVNAQVSGSEGLEKTGGGTLVLTNATNNYTGTTTVSAGTLQLGNGGTTGSLNTASALVFAANTNFQINQTDTVTQGVDFSGAAFTGNVNLIKAGTGNLVLTGNNTVRELRVNNATGFVDIGSGSLFVNNGGGNTISSSTGGTINGTGTITISTGGGTNFGDNSTANGTTLTINPRVTGGAGNGFEYCCTAGGTIFLANNANDFGGGILISTAGTIRTSTINNIGVASGLGLGNQINLNVTGANLDYVGSGSTTNRNINLGNNALASITQSGTGNLLFNGAFTGGSGNKTLTLQGSTAGTGEISSVIGNGGGTQAIAKSGTGTWILSGANTYTGTTTVNEGILQIRDNSALGTTAGGTSVTRGGILQLDGARTIGAETLTFGGADTVGGANPILSTSGAGSKSWTGNLVGDQNFTVDSTVAGTLLTLSGNVNLKASTMTVSGPGDTLISGVISNAFNSSGVASGLREMTINGNSFDEVSANISGNLTPGVTQGNTNTGWADNRTFIYTGQFFDADGIFTFAEQIDDNVRVVIDGVTRLRSTNWDVATGTHQTNGLRNDGANIANANTFGGTTSFGMGPNGDGWHDIEIRLGNGSGGSGPQTQQGWVNTSKGFAFFDGASPASLNGSNFTVITDPGNASVFRNLQTAVPLIKNGTGTLTLTGANTYAGGTTVNDGTLLVNNVTGSALGTGDVIVNLGATLGGSGAFTGDLLLNTGAIIAPDGSLDTGSLTFGNNAIYNWEVGDLINVLGDLTFVGDAIINIIDNGAPAIGTHALFTWTGNLTGFDPANFTFNLSGFTTGFASSVFADFGSNTIFLVNVVPEPASVSLLALAGMTLLGRRSRRSEA